MKPLDLSVTKRFVAGRFAIPSMAPGTRLRRMPMMVMDFTPLEQGCNPILDELLADVGDVTSLARKRTARYNGLRPEHSYPYLHYWPGLSAKEAWNLRIKRSERPPRGSRAPEYSRKNISDQFTWVVDLEAGTRTWQRIR